MDSSSWFRVYTQQLNALLRLGFPTASLKSVKLAIECKSLTHYTKGTPSLLRAPTVCMHIGFRIYFTPLPGFFSPFPHGTGSLSVDY